MTLIWCSSMKFPKTNREFKLKKIEVFVWSFLYFVIVVVIWLFLILKLIDFSRYRFQTKKWYSKTLYKIP